MIRLLLYDMIKLLDIRLLLYDMKYQEMNQEPISSWGL